MKSFSKLKIQKCWNKTILISLFINLMFFLNFNIKVHAAPSLSSNSSLNSLSIMNFSISKSSSSLSSSELTPKSSSKSDGNKISTNNGTWTKATNCPPHIEQQIDQLTLRLFTFGKSGRRFPESFQQFSKYCNETKILKKQFHNFIDDCVEDPFIRNMLKITLYSVEKESKLLCKPREHPTKRQVRLIETAACINSPKIKNAHQRCANKAIKYLMDSVEMTDNHKKLGYICCNVQHMDTCMHDAIANDKSGKCGIQKADITMEFLDSVRGNAIDFLCSEFTPESDQCNAYYSEHPKSGTSGYSFYIMPLIKSLANVDVKFKI